MSDKKYKIGLNRFIKNKPAKGSGVNHATDWVPSEVSKDELIAHIQSGFAFSAHYEDEYRKTENFICSDFVAADMDGTMTLDEALNTPFIQQFASFIYTTPSHTADYPRFRVVFLLEETVTRAPEWRNCLLGLALRLGGDRSIKDAGRLFYGSSGCQIIDLGHTLSKDEADNLIKLGADDRFKNSPQRKGRGTLMSSVKVASDTVITLRNGQQATLAQLPANTAVHCPIHVDTKPSAFVIESSRGTKGIHCMSCGMSYWPDDGDGYDFDAFDNLVHEKVAAYEVERIKTEQNPNPLLALFPPAPTVFQYQQQFLPPLRYHPGITVVKSPKGSGKTEALLHMIGQIRSNRVSRDIPRRDRPKSVLLIGHRRSLIREAANRLYLDCYLDKPYDYEHGRPEFGYAICLDSLHKLSRGFKYDTIIIDESEQVISHLLAETLKSGAGTSKTFAALNWLCRFAKSIVALDADLGLITLHALSVLRKDLWAQDLRIVYNKPLEVSEKRRMSVYTNRTHIRDRLLEAVRDGKRCFVACNSKRHVHVIEQLLRKEFGDSLAMMAITSDNSQDEVESKFIQNIQTEILNIQVLICSPSLGTGIDITFPEGRCEIHEVFGFFSPLVNKHTDIDQQLSRVRNPGNVSVWFQSGRTAFETNTDVVRHHLARAHYVPTALTGELTDEGEPIYDRDDPLLNVVTHVRVAQWASQNNIRQLFEKLRRSTGWEIDHVSTPDGLKGDRKWEDAEIDTEERRIDRVMSARTLNVIEYTELTEKEKRGKRMLLEDRCALERYRIERLYQAPIERIFVAQYRGGVLVDWIENFQIAFGRNGHAPAVAEEFEFKSDRPLIIKKQSPWRIALYALGSIKMIHNNGIAPHRRVSAPDFKDFIEMCDNNRVIIQEVFNSSIRGDLRKNPVRQFNDMIRCLGLGLSKSGRKRINGVTRETYRVDPDGVKFMIKMMNLYEKQMG